jgi:oligopeptide/dipeptide ABC transporter ATP-binding protein
MIIKDFKTDSKDNILSIRDLKTYFYIPEGLVRAVDGISFNLEDSEIIGIVGESGSGKSVTALSILGLISWPPGRILNGEIIFRNSDLRKIQQSTLRNIRGKQISMIFQEPMTSLNPCYTIGRQICEVYTAHTKMTKKEALENAKEWLNKMQIQSPSKIVYEYPHNLSGGMRQRVMIAMAMCCNPNLILADEPTTALDVTIQAQILDLMAILQDKYKTSIILITHNLGIVSELASRVLVMYCGQIVEEGRVEEIFQEALHPYTVGLLNSIPTVGRKTSGQKRRLSEIPGVVPSMWDLPKGCNFTPRCLKKKKICENEQPALINIDQGRRVACWAVSGNWS